MCSFLTFSLDICSCNCYSEVCLSCCNELRLLCNMFICSFRERSMFSFLTSSLDICSCNCSSEVYLSCCNELRLLCNVFICSLRE